MLDEQQVPQVLEQVGDEPAEILPALRELLDERERPGGVPIDDEVAEPEERLFLDGAERLEHLLHRDLALRRGRQLIEGRLRVAVGAAGGPRDQRQCRVRHLDALAVGEPA